MSGVESVQSITNYRNQYEQELCLAKKSQVSAGVIAARNMIKLMDNGDPFEIDDFIFAASLGNSNMCREERQILAKAACANTGELFGVRGVIGVAADQPLAMNVKLHGVNPDDSQKRTLTASINFAIGVRVVSSENYYSRPKVVLQEEPFSVPIMTSRSEKHWVGAKFDQGSVKNVMVGANEILDYGMKDDVYNRHRTEVATLISRLAELAIK